MTSIDEYHQRTCNVDILKNIVEAQAKAYPQYQEGIATTRQWLLVEELFMYSDAVIATDNEGNQGFCIYTITEDPHVVGKCLFMQMTVSNSPACTRAIMKHLFKEAYANACTYIWISKRTGEYSYEGTFHKLRKR